jgi:hypothetical protein
MESRAFDDVLNKVNSIIPMYLKWQERSLSTTYSFDHYDSFMGKFWVAVNATSSLFEATMAVMEIRNQLETHIRSIGYSKALKQAFADMMEILKSTRKYYGVSNEILFKHDMVLQ